MDAPAKAFKAGVNGVAGGENMLRRPDGTVRYFTNLEALRLQTFPDDYTIIGNRTSTVKQIGNAVPPLLSYMIASSICRVL